MQLTITMRWGAMANTCLLYTSEIFVADIAASQQKHPIICQDKFVMQQCIPFPWPEQIYEVINTVFDIGMRTQRKGDITPRAGKAAHSAVQRCV